MSSLYFKQKTSQLSEYNIIEPIGKGKFATVFRGTRKSDNLTVALKKISLLELDANSKEMYLKEAEILKTVQHPNIVTFLDSFQTEHELYIVEEWVPAGDLQHQIHRVAKKRAKFSERLIWKYFSQIAEAVKSLHNRRILHRDLKPANILLTEDATIKVSDFGLGKIFSDGTMQAYSKVGTPLYMSPETINGSGYDWKSDIWSLGCILYELAALMPPFRDNQMYALSKQIIKGEYTPLPESYSEDLRNLVAQMLETDPSNRPDIIEVADTANLMLRFQTKQRAINSYLKPDGSMEVRLDQLLVTSEKTAELVKIAMGECRLSSKIEPRHFERPTFSFLQRVILLMFARGGFGGGLYTESDHVRIEDTTQKMNFLQKCIDLIGFTFEILPINPLQVIAGLESPELIYKLLQYVALASLKGMDSSESVKKILNHEKPTVMRKSLSNTRVSFLPPILNAHMNFGISLSSTLSPTKTSNSHTPKSPTKVAA